MLADDILNLILRTIEKPSVDTIISELKVIVENNITEVDSINELFNINSTDDVNQMIKNVYDSLQAKVIEKQSEISTTMFSRLSFVSQEIDKRIYSIENRKLRIAIFFFKLNLSIIANVMSSTMGETKKKKYIL